MLVSLLLCAVVLFTPYIVLNILAERRLIAVSDLSVIKIGTSIWNLLYIWIIAPKVDKKIDKIFEKIMQSNLNQLSKLQMKLKREKKTKSRGQGDGSSVLTRQKTRGRFFCPEKLTYRGRGAIRTPPSFWGALDLLGYIHYNDNRQFSYLCK